MEAVHSRATPLFFTKGRTRTLSNKTVSTAIAHAGHLRQSLLRVQKRSIEDEFAVCKPGLLGRFRIPTDVEFTATKRKQHIYNNTRVACTIQLPEAAVTHTDRDARADLLGSRGKDNGVARREDDGCRADRHSRWRYSESRRPCRRLQGGACLRTTHRHPVRRQRVTAARMREYHGPAAFFNAVFSVTSSSAFSGALSWART